MTEAEIKHSRMSMLAVLGWVAVDLGVRFPGEKFASIPNSLAAHNAAVENGSLG
jgi:methanogenic corrinoid protein MtbC1